MSELKCTRNKEQEISDIMCQAHGMTWQLPITLRLTAVSTEGTALF